MVSVDEAQLNRGMSSSFGWSFKGTGASKFIGRKGQPIQILVAITKNRVLGYMLRDSRVDHFGYKFFMGRVIEKLKQMSPLDYKERYFFFMDNAGAHKTKVIRDYLEMCEIPTLCNAPMSPQV